MLHQHAFLVGVVVAAAVADPPSQSNMNIGSPYIIANDNPAAPVKYNTAYSSKNASFFEVYAGPIETRYGEVFWQGLPQVEFPPQAQSTPTLSSQAVATL